MYLPNRSVSVCTFLCMYKAIYKQNIHQKILHDLGDKFVIFDNPKVQQKNSLYLKKLSKLNQFWPFYKYITY